MIIYLITNKINGKQYIGQTSQSLKRRWNGHKKSGSGINSVVRAAINKYGYNNFFVEEIDSAINFEELNNLEKYYIKFYNTLSPSGGNGPI